MFVKPSSAFVGKPSVVASSSGSAKKARYARLFPSTRKSSESRAGASSRSSSRPVRVFGDMSPSVFSADSISADSIRRWLGSRFCPVRGSCTRPRRTTRSSSGRRRPPQGSRTSPPRCGTRSGSSTSWTILVAGGLARRLAQHQLESLVTPEVARRFHGRVVVHDVEDPELVELDADAQPPLRVNRALVETDLVVVVTAAESVLHGGPAALLGAAGGDALRAAGAYSLLETAASQGWHLGLARERALAQR